ncbi:stomatin-like protein 1 [Patiria miniata]|uniref:Band 7 domain-containing protein n=1 Tax=Patiria miniata TaxID=46514 RepID=A0A914A9V3_PATMI|nr:stomatin-like protein 1 [Patiria miniata]
MTSTSPWSSSVKYSRLPKSEWDSASQDSAAIDFSSPFNFESAFTYSKVMPPYVEEERKYTPSLLTRICTSVVVFLGYALVFLTFPISGFLAIKMVQQFERIVVFRLGRLQQPKGPGLVIVLPFIDKWRRVDMRTRAFNVPPQQFITADGAAISIGATVYFRTKDVSLSIASVQDLNHSTRMLAQTILLNTLTPRSLKSIENDMNVMNQLIREEMNTTTNNWGVEVSKVELSQVTVVQEAVDGVSLDKLGTIFSQLISGQHSPMPNLAHMSTPPSALMTALLPPSQPRPSPPRGATQTPMVTPQELLSSVKPFLNEALVADVGAVYKFVVTGSNGGTFFLDLKNGSGDAGSGEPPDTPDVTLTTTTFDLHAMFTGQLRPYAAYMASKLTVEGDRGVAMKLDTVMQQLREARC